VGDLLLQLGQTERPVIWIIEPDSAMCDTLTFALQSFGYPVLEATCLADLPPKPVPGEVLVVAVADEDDLAMLRTFRKRIDWQQAETEAPMVLLAATDDFVEELSEITLTEVLVKPIDLVELDRAISRLAARCPALT
jgi:CheY-like chemotaxis protein